MKVQEDRVSSKIWFSVIIFGLFGQVAWVIENMYFNVFVYKTITEDPDVIAIMVAASAIVATVTTLLMGVLSDKLGKRKLFISLGYIIWGFIIMLFAQISVDNTARLFPNLNYLQWISITAAIVVVMDCVMTFFGSTANDAAYNAWVTDVVSDKNRGKVEGVISALPLLAVLVVFGGFDPLIQAEKWDLFYYIIGGLVSLSGFLGLFLLQDQCKKREETSYLQDLIYGFRVSVIKANKTLYLVFLAILIASTAQQVFMPYLIIYLENYLQIADYALLLGVVLLLSSVGSVLLGRQVDKHGKQRFMIPSVLVFAFGSLLMYLIGKAAGSLEAAALKAALAVFGTVMMLGSLLLALVFNALARDKMPESQRGHFNGIRMIFYVMLPMVIGPFIGSNIIKASSTTYVDEYGLVQSVPIPEIFLATSLVSLLIIIPALLLNKRLDGEGKNNKPLYTRWGRELDRNNPLPEYPRPQLERDSYVNLNGVWEYAIYKRDEEFRGYQGEIVVPFSPESPLSGVGRRVAPEDYLYYKREFTIDEGFLKDKTLLHFGAVDSHCDVYLNGQYLGFHSGGYLPFSFDVTGIIKAGPNVLTLRVSDPTDTSYISRGKQVLKRGGIWYTAQSGIWQTVWLESVPEVYVEKLYLTPDIDNGTITIKPILSRTPERLLARIMDHGEVVAEAELEANVDNVIKLEEFKLWSPETPHLYDLEICADGDRARSYFGMRKFSLGTDEQGCKRIFLNNKPYFNNGLLDQGYWPDGLLTPPSDEAMRHDILTMKKLGFNMLRKHIKIEPLRWYYHCDKLGMLVWQDMVNGGEKYNLFTVAVLPFLGFKLNDGPKNYRKFGRLDPRGRESYYRELADMLDLLYNAVCINVWVLFNEGWGQFDALKAVEFIRERDATRLIDHASGWHDQGGGDFNSPHVYFVKFKMPADKNRAVVLSEFGGYSYQVKGHVFNENKVFGYRKFKDRESYAKAFQKLYREQIIPCLSRGLSATVYTQLSDVEDEVNGLFTYDREVLKLTASELAEINAQLKLG
ncbi:MAG: MFS transporter [Dethiobacteria bacterium]|nr:MFS transporter [Bacillota bacterium]